MINRISENAVKADDYIALIPGVSTVNIVINTFERIGVHLLNSKVKDPYLKKATSKSFARCVTEFIPVIGNAILAASMVKEHINKKKAEKEAKNASTSIGETEASLENVHGLKLDPPTTQQIYESIENQLDDFSGEEIYTLGEVYSKDREGQDLILAYDLFVLAAKLKNHQPSNEKLAKMYYYGLGGVEKNQAKAQEFLDRLPFEKYLEVIAYNKNLDSSESDYIQFGIKFVEAGRLDNAYKSYKQAGVEGIKSLIHLGELAQIKGDLNLTYKCYKKALSIAQKEKIFIPGLDLKEHFRDLGYALVEQEKIGSAQNQPKALECFTMAARMGEKDSMYLLAKKLEGSNKLSDRQARKDWLEKAALLGHEVAKKELIAFRRQK